MTASAAQRFGDLYRSYHAHVWAYCRRRSAPDAVDDLVADVFLTVWRRIEDAPADDAVLGWIYRIAYLTASNHWRTKGRHKRLQHKLASIGQETLSHEHDQFVVREEVRAVLDAAGRLRPGDREILRLSLWEELTHEEIGGVLDISPNTAKQRLFRARHRLLQEVQRSSRIAVAPAAQEGGAQ